MSAYPGPLKNLLDELKRLPGVGAKSAERYAFFLLKDEKADALRLADAVRAIKEDLTPCPECGLVTDEPPCAVCRDPKRDRGIVLVVEQPKDVYALEALGRYRGVYFVLLGTVRLLDGVDERQLDLKPLERRLRSGEVREVVLGLTAELEGDQTALHLAQWLRPFGVAITRLARGLGPGQRLADAPRSSLEDALLERRPIAPG